MSRTLLPGVIAMAVIVVTSNILVQFLYGNWLTYGAFTYPFAFLVTDVMNRVYGSAAARRVVVVGFVVGLASSIVGTQIIGQYGPLVTWRIAIGSGTAFLAAQMIDVAVFNLFRKGAWWRAPLASTLVGSSLDTMIFFSIAFSANLSWIEPANDVGWVNKAVPLLGSGPVEPLWMSLAVADFSVKLAIALVALVPFRLVVGWLLRGIGGQNPSAPLGWR